MQLIGGSFFTILNSIAPLSNDEQEAIAAVVTAKELGKGEYWIQEGKKARLLGFIEKGYLRKYYIRDGKELTDFFYLENSFIGDLPSILANKPSIAHVIVMEPSTVLTFSYAALDALCNKHHRIEHIMRVMAERAFLTFYYRSVSFVSATPKERYAQLVADHPDVLQRATQYHIASFLGITPQHLSRLRGNDHPDSK